MSFSRMVLQFKNKNNKTPSPTLQQVKHHLNSRVCKNNCKSFMERISLPASCPGRKEVRGSMTVEASLLLPLVLFFFLHIMGFVEMLRLHGKLTFALWEYGTDLSVYAALPQELDEMVPDLAVSYFYVKNRVEDFLGEDYLDTSPVVQGSDGLCYLCSSYSEECIDIGVTYEITPKLTLFPFPYMRMVNRYYGKAWTGYDLSKEVNYVYVTRYGEVWHRTAECSYLRITVQSVAREGIGMLRNAAGGRYYACQLCEEEEMGAVVYYTEQGNRYHRSESCFALTRYIQAVEWQEDLPYRPCSRCAGKGSE